MCSTRVCRGPLRLFASSPQVFTRSAFYLHTQTPSAWAAASQPLTCALASARARARPMGMRRDTHDDAREGSAAVGGGWASQRQPPAAPSLQTVAGPEFGDGQYQPNNMVYSYPHSRTCRATTMYSAQVCNAFLRTGCGQVTYNSRCK